MMDGLEDALDLPLLFLLDSHAADAPTVRDIIDQTHTWSKRKRQFSPHQIQLALKVLAGKGWLPLERAA